MTMKGHTPNNIQFDNQAHQPRKSTRYPSTEIQLNLESPKSTKSNPETKTCTFERDRAGYGFKITGNAPVKVQAVRQDGVAWASGLRENDVIIKVNGTPVAHKLHKDVVALIRKDSRVELLVECDNSRYIFAANNSSPNQINPSLVNNRIPKYDTNPQRPTSIPKVSSVNKPSLQNQLQTGEDSRVELVTESDNLRSASTPTNSSPKRIPPSPLNSRIPKYDTNPPRPNSIPKVAPRVRVTSESQMIASNKYQSIERNKVNVPIVMRHENNVHKPADDHNSPLSSSEFSLSTSSGESESDKVKLPVKPKVTGITSPPQSEQGTPLKSNSYNIPKNLIATKHASLQKKSLEESCKNKTIPPDGAKSYNPSIRGNIEDKSSYQTDYSTLPKNSIRGNIEDKSSHQTDYSTLPKNKSSGGLILGRDFDDDNKCDEESDNSLSVMDMLSSVKEALSKPSLVAILLSYVKEKFDDMKMMIFYYTCKLYKSMVLKRDFTTGAPRMANEIITTFLLEKSPLIITVNIDTINETINIFKTGETLGALFDPLINVVHEILKDIVDDVKGKLTRGIQLNEDVSALVNSITSSISQEKEMTLLHRTMCNIFTKNQKDFNDIKLATQIGLATMYLYFNNSNFLPGASIRAKSSDSINNIVNQPRIQTIGEFFKINTFCAPYQQKLSLGLRKKNKSVNGHTLIEAVCLGPEECAICDGLLWGTSPQGLFCTMCLNYYHTLCKKKIKNTCSKKLKKSTSQLNKEDKSAFFGRLSRKSSSNSVRNLNFSGENVSSQNFNNGVLLPDEKTGSFCVDGTNDLSKSQSEDHLNRISLQNRNLSTSIDINGLVDIDPNIIIQELVPEETISDPDMKVAESFDAYTELITVFPEVSESEKKRLIVLLEFYHKTRYILMNLKRFQYRLVQKWPVSQGLYFKALSLYCIVPFVTLIKSLVVTIEKCITNKGFVGLDQAVLDWLSKDNDDNLKEWVSLSSNLCCTNSLNIVKQMKQTTLRTIAELIPLMNAKFHKLVIIEELTQIRPLLISLPLIVKNIIKSLTKQEELYKEELSVWKQVSVKMDYLCEYIDRCCIPLVDWINNGTILRRAEKFEVQCKEKDFEKEIKDFCLDFPRTLFHFPIFDFQYAKIMTWSTNTKRIGVEIQSAYLKKGADVLLIFYKTFIVVLQKENDHFVLKPIKPLRNLFDRQPPIIDIGDGIIVKNGGQEENFFILNIISHRPDNALLLRIGFTRLEVVESWIEYISTKTYSLARSISIFKNNDLRSIPESQSNFERTPSYMSLKSKTTQELFDNSLFSNNSSEVETKAPENNVAAYLSLSETLTKASEILDQNESLCEILNVTEDKLPDLLKIIKDDGVKSIDDITLTLYTLSQSLLRHTHRSVANSCSKVTYPSELDLDQVKNMLTETCELIDKWKETVKVGDQMESKVMSPLSAEQDDHIIPKIQLRMRSEPRRDVCDERRDNPQRDNESCEDSLNCEVRAIVEEIIEEAINRVRTSKKCKELINSYKYVPLDSLMPSFEENTYLSETVMTTDNFHLNSALEETVTVSRAQIILHNKNSYKH